MVWETVKKEMTITRVLLATVAILLCCYLTFGLSHETEKDKANNEQGLEMLNLFREYFEKNESQPAHPQAIHGNIPKEGPKPRKFYSVDPSFKKSVPESQNTKHSDLDIGNSKHVAPSVHSTNTSKNSSEPEMDLVVVFDVNKQPEHKDTILDVKNTGTKHVDKIMLNEVIFSKTVRVSKVEEVFEDLTAQNVRRIIKEDRAEKVEISRNNKMESVGSELGIKDLLSL